MAQKPKLSLEQQIDLQQIVAVEVEQHRRGEIENFTTTRELALVYNTNKDRISIYLRKLIPAEDLKYRNSHLASQIRSGENHSMYGKHHSEEIKRKISEANSGERGYWYGKTLPEKIRKKMSLGQLKRKERDGSTILLEAKLKILEWFKTNDSPMKGKKHSELTRRKMKINHANVNGENNPRWNGGTSFLPYSHLFTLILKKYVRARDEYQCQFCGISEDGKAHAVHHMTMTKIMILNSIY
ncbi:hypothetical protein J4429_04760 [Candidatus Pacearchaeota archaeon]|nr:hypothetical protein [Candidatus Pacearchaeota archaeon]